MKCISHTDFRAGYGSVSFKWHIQDENIRVLINLGIIPSS